MERVQNLVYQNHSILYEAVIQGRRNGWKHFLARHQDVLVVFGELGSERRLVNRPSDNGAGGCAGSVIEIG